jgi:hypothetical protein
VVVLAQEVSAQRNEQRAAAVDAADFPAQMLPLGAPARTRVTLGRISLVALHQSFARFNSSF